MNYPDSYRNLSSIERQATWSRIQGSISRSTEFSPSPYSPTNSHIKKPLLSRDYAIAFLCVLLLSSTTSVAAAADHSLPTSALYAIKLNITEPIRTLTKTTPESRIDWEIERTERRLEETRQLIELNTLTPEIARDISSNIEKHTTEAQSRIAELSATDSNQSTVLSLSLVETIEKKKEEIIISTEHNFVPTDEYSTQTAFSTKIESAVPTSSPAATHIASTLEPAPAANPAPTLISQTDSVLAILSTADIAQAATDTLIQTINSQVTELALAKKDSTEVVPAEPNTPTTDPNVVTFTLVLSDIQDQISELRTTLDIPETITDSEQTATVAKDNPPAEDTHPLDPDAPPAVNVPPDTPPEPNTVASEVTVSDLVSTLSNALPAPEALPSADQSVTTLRTTDILNSPTQVPPLAPKADSDVNTPREEPAENSSTTSTASTTVSHETAESAQLLDEIISEYSNLKKVSQPSLLDIDEARALRRKAETYISSLRLKTKRNTEQSSTTIPTEILEQISVQPLNTTQAETINEAPDDEPNPPSQPSEITTDKGGTPLSSLSNSTETTSQTTQ